MMGKKLVNDARERKVLAKPLKEYVSKNHLLVKIDENIDLSFIYDEVDCLYAGYGTDSIDPVVVFKMLLIGYLYNIQSERNLVEAIGENLAYRYFIGYALDEQIPYRSAFTRIRQRWGEEGFRRIFNRILELCINAGLVGGKSTSIDATTVKAKGPREREKLQLEKGIDQYLSAVCGNEETIEIEKLQEIKKISLGSDTDSKKKHTIAI